MTASTRCNAWSGDVRFSARTLVRCRSAQLELVALLRTALRTSPNVIGPRRYDIA
jgi:hypothetical protein